MSISREGVFYLAVMGVILTAAVIRQINLLMLLYGVLAGPLLLSWRLVRRALKQVDVARRLPKTVFAGEPFTVELEVFNHKKRGGSFALVVRDELQKRGDDAGRPVAADVYFPYVPAGESRRGSYHGLLNGRGTYDFQPLKISSRFPLGLLRTMLRLDKPQRLLVLPQVGKLSAAWQRLWRADEESAAGPRRRGGVHEGDFYGLREYRPGDAQSRIHWRTSARRQTLTVRQYERKRQIVMALVLDLWEPRHPSAEDRRRTEEVIRFGATVAAEVCREAGRELFLEIVGKTSRTVRAITSSQLMHECFKALAAAEAARDDRLNATLEKVVAQLRPGTNLLIAGTRRNNLDDQDRFPLFAERPELQTWAHRAACLTVGDTQWSQLFQAGAAS